MQQNQQQWPYYLKGRNMQTRQFERHAYYASDGKVIHQCRVGKNRSIARQRLSGHAALDQIVELLLSGLSPHQLVAARPPWQNALFQLELFFRSYSSLVYFTGLTAASSFYAVVVGVSQWYEWLGFVSALILGALITKATKLSFWGINIETEQWTQKILYESAKQQAWSQLISSLPQNLGPSPPEESDEG